MRGVGFHQLHRSDLGVDVIGLAAGRKKLRRDLRMPRGHAARGCETCVVRAPRAENDFVLRIILRKKRLEVGLEAGLRTMQWLQQRKRRRESGARGEFGERAAAFAKVPRNGPESHGDKNCRSQQAENSYSQRDVRHTANRIPFAGQVRRQGSGVFRVSCRVDARRSGLLLFGILPDLHL